MSLIPTLFEQTGLVTVVNYPLAQGGQAIFELVEEQISYAHEIGAKGGYLNAQIIIQSNLDDINDWYEIGLARDFVVYDNEGQVRFEGFANQVTINLGGLAETRGPLMNVGNRVSAVYAPIDYDVWPPAVGATTVTLINENTDSQALYGIIEKILSAGTTPQATAEQARDTFLKDKGLPQTTGPLSIIPGGTIEASVTIDLLGYYFFMSYVYNNLGVIGAVTFTTKITDILAADPNVFISTDYSDIAINAYLTNDGVEGNRFAKDLILALINIGDVNDNRYNFGIYEGRKAKYEPIPSDYEYQHLLSDEAQLITDENDGIIRPWQVLPGKWIFVPDFLPGRISVATEIREDPRKKFIESVRYTAPTTLDLSGGQTDRLSQLLAKIQGGGIV